MFCSLLLYTNIQHNHTFSKYLMQKMHPNAIEICYNEVSKYNVWLWIEWLYKCNRIKHIYAWKSHIHKNDLKPEHYWKSDSISELESPPDIFFIYTEKSWNVGSIRKFLHRHQPMAECERISCCRFSMLSSADWPRIVVMYTVYILTDLGACVCVCAPAYIYSL